VKPVCVKCQCFYRPKKNGYVFMEMMPSGGDPAEFRKTSFEERRGTKMPHLWQPYKLWRGDLWACPECEHETIVGVAYEPISEHYKPDFADAVKALPPQVVINDC
jgi:hypothetical protein